MFDTLAVVQRRAARRGALRVGGQIGGSMRTRLPVLVLVMVAALAAGARVAQAQPMSAPTNLGWGDGPGSLSTAEGVFLYFEFQAVPDSGTFYRYRLRSQGGGFGSWMPTGSVESLGGNRLAAELVGHDWENHVTYTVELQASTSEGGGPAASITFTPKWLNLPQNVRVTPGDGRLTVAWDPPVENSCAVLSYWGFITYHGGGSGPITDQEVFTGTEVTITGLTNGAEHGISVLATAGYDPPCLDDHYAGDGPVDSGQGPTVYGTPTAPTPTPVLPVAASWLLAGLLALLGVTGRGFRGFGRR
jgi:hypothetical protein